MHVNLVAKNGVNFSGEGLSHRNLERGVRLSFLGTETIELDKYKPCNKSLNLIVVPTKFKLCQFDMQISSRVC